MANIIYSTKAKKKAKLPRFSLSKIIFFAILLSFFFVVLILIPFLVKNTFDVRQQAQEMSQSFTPIGMRPLSDPIYGVTVDNIANVSNIVNSSKALSRMPTTRIVFDDGVQPSYYISAANQIQPVSYIMGELLDSEGLAANSVQAYRDRTASYLQALGNTVDIWEVGNEVNGNWTGPYDQVSAKIYEAYKQVNAAGKRSALTLWYNDSCGNGPSELDPIAFSQQYVPVDMRNGLNYLFVSYYETQCSNIRPTAEKLTIFFNHLHTLYPNARLGFGEIGFPNKVGTNTQAAISMINYYYSLSIPVPGYVGGYFWWYYYQDMLPYTTKPLWQTLSTAFTTMPASTIPLPTVSAPVISPTVSPTIVINPTQSVPVSPTPTIALNPTQSPPPTSSTILGTNKIGRKLDSGNANTIDGSLIKTSNNGVTTISATVYVGNVDVSPYNNYEVAIYTNSNGKPSSLVGKSETNRLIGNAWNTVPLSVYLQPNTAYWLVYNTNARSNKLNNLRYSDVSTKKAYYLYHRFGEWPQSITQGTTWTGEFSMYVTVK